MNLFIAKFIYTEDFLETVDFENMYETEYNLYYSMLYPQHHSSLPF